MSNQYCQDCGEKFSDASRLSNCYFIVTGTGLKCPCKICRDCVFTCSLCNVRCCYSRLGNVDTMRCHSCQYPDYNRNSRNTQRENSSCMDVVK
jgi:hypothetical protein